MIGDTPPVVPLPGNSPPVAPFPGKEPPLEPRSGLACVDEGNRVEAKKMHATSRLLIRLLHYVPINCRRDLRRLPVYYRLKGGLATIDSADSCSLDLLIAHKKAILKNSEQEPAKGRS
jgi:hypothetical protein